VWGSSRGFMFRYFWVEALVADFTCRMQSNAISPRQAAELLVAHSAAGLTLDEALAVVEHMQPLRVPRGAALLREGAAQARNFMLLVIEGEVRVECRFNDNDALLVERLGAGSLLGELSLLDDAARVATCTAHTDVLAAMLTREALETLFATHPSAAGHLAMGIAQNIAQRLRTTLRRLKTHVQISKKLNHEMDLLMGSQVAAARQRISPKQAAVNEYLAKSAVDLIAI
jgi:CRP/FNR family transcriptional regulator, cyclic AMP receptor protein